MELNGGEEENTVIVDELLRPVLSKSKDHKYVDFGDQWRIGARGAGPQNATNVGKWFYEHSEEELHWFDWLEGQPDDYIEQEASVAYVRENWFTYVTYKWIDYLWSLPYLLLTYLLRLLLHLPYLYLYLCYLTYICERPTSPDYQWNSAKVSTSQRTVFVTFVSPICHFFMSVPFVSLLYPHKLCGTISVPSVYKSNIKL